MPHSARKKAGRFPGGMPPTTGTAAVMSPAERDDSFMLTIARRRGKRADPMRLRGRRAPQARAASLPRSRVKRMQKRSASPTSMDRRISAS